MIVKCPSCGEPLDQAVLVCPHCGAALPEQSGASPRRGLWLRLALIALAVLVFVGAMGGAAYLGVYMGERDREARRAAAIDSHYQAGIQALNDGDLERAIAEFNYVLEIEPDHALAQQGLAEARIRLEVKPTPTLEVAQSLADQLFEQAQSSYAEQDWVATARTLTQLRALDPTYAQDVVEDMLFESLYHAGQQYLEQDLLEVGISYLDQAIALRPLDADLIAQRNLAARYLDALSYWGVDWEACIERLNALYAIAPDYKDVAQRLFRAQVAYGDYFMTQGEACPAEIQYTKALRMAADPQLEKKHTEAAQTCLIATPVPISGTLPILTPQPIAGFSMGRLAYTVYDPGTGSYNLYALYADGKIVRVATNADQPSWEWGTGRLVYRDRAAGSLRLILPGEGVPLTLLNPGQQAWPTLSPDSQRMAFAVTELDGTWAIYIANTDGSGEPQRLANGRAPAWGRGGLLAYTGCDADGMCGIIVDNPDDDQPGTRLTASENDLAVSWAPAGNLMAYMSNVTGNWDLFLLSPEGGVQQLTREATDEGLPAWSPDGSRMAFVSNRGGNWGIYVMQLGSPEAQKILDLGTSFPQWESQRLSWAP